MNKFFILHGHFYQPPREDPWWQDVSRQDSAYPAHDWNERIYWECYLPNATARIYDNEGKIIDLVNNYSYINFNFGPTLLIWLKNHHPDFIELLKEADNKSKRFNNGHGNAIAQAYNHMIMPLASSRDKETQIYWGKKFFKSIFNRETEGIWLPETACNYETLKSLIKQNIKYIILSPHQAERVRKIGDSSWMNVSKGDIDIQRAYRIFIDKDKEQYIDCFFYNGALSHAISFQNMMNSAQSCAERINASYTGVNSLVSIATDGETFGHHHPFSEMCLAYLMKQELPSRGVLCTNYTNFLSMFAPEYEVELKRGTDGLGTAWSCSHGVRRWYDDCGCKVGFYASWNQSWRKPLRDALDWLREEIDSLFVKKGEKIFKDPWAARNDFIEVIIDSSDSSIRDFYQRHSLNNDIANLVTAMKLLEAEHMGMLFYTSCAWFFDEVSGIEAVQNLKYAARAIQLAEEISGIELESEFLKRLANARSNIAVFGNAKAVYERLVKPNLKRWDDYLSSYLVYNVFFQAQDKYYKFDINKEDEHKIAKGEDEVYIGKINSKDIRLQEKTERIYLLRKENLKSFECYLSSFDSAKFNELKQLFEGEVWISDKAKLNEVINRFFNSAPYGIKDVYSKEQEKIVELIFAHRRESIFEDLNKIWARNLPLFEDYRNIGLLLPYEMHLLGASIISYKIKDAFLKFKQDLDFKRIDAIKNLFKEAVKMRLDMELADTNEIVQKIAAELACDIAKTKDPEKVNVLIRFHREMLNLNIDYHTYIVQNSIASLIQNTKLTPEIEELARVYSFNCIRFLETKTGP